VSTRSNPTAVHPGAPIRPAGATQLATRQIMGGLGALGILAIGLVGIPLILALVVGWPLPHQVPTGAEMVHALGGAIPDSFWPRLFATLAWLAWVYFVVSVGTSLVLQLRGRRVGCRPRLVGSGTVAALIGAALVLGQLRGAQGVVHPSGSRSLASRASVVQLLARTTSGAASPLAIVPISADASSITPATQRTTVTHIVVPGDTLWSIAVQYYGDGEHWQTIFEANVGRLQPGGATLSDAHWIYPGWSLAIPGVTLATPLSPAIAPPREAAVPVAPSVIPSPGASGSPNGAANAGVTRARSALGINRGNNGPVATRPSEPPASATIPPLVTHHATRAAPSGAPSPRPSLTLHHRGATSPTHADGSIAVGTRPAGPRLPGSDVGPLAMGAGLFGLSAIGLVGALDRRRRRQLGRRTLGGRIPRPAPQSPLADLELQLRHYARAREVFWLCHVAQLLGHAADVAGVAPPAVMGVEIVRDGLDVLVPGEETVPLSPFVDQADRPGLWHLPFATDPGVIDEAVASPPAPVVLATVGQSARGALLVNVNYYRSIHLVVPPERAEGTLAALATELAGTTAPAGTSVVAVGFGYGVIDRLDGGVVLDDLQAAATMTLHHQGAIVLVDPRTTTDRLLDALSGTGEVHLVTAGPLAPEGTALIIDPDHPCLEEALLTFPGVS